MTWVTVPSGQLHTKLLRGSKAEIVSHALSRQHDAAANVVVGHLTSQCQISLGDLEGGNPDTRKPYIAL